MFHNTSVWPRINDDGLVPETVMADIVNLIRFEKMVYICK